jgi:dUTP pyrophosphatase
MDNSKIVDYLNKLKEYQSILDKNEGDQKTLNEFENLLNQLNDDVKVNMNKQFNGLTVKYKKLTENAVEPKYAKHGDAGLDLTITSVISETDTNITYGFGVSVEIPYGYVGLLFPRSSIRNFQIILSNCVGVIDSGYRGEIQATFKKTNTEATSYQINERGAQLIILPYPQIKMVEADELSSTERGDKGYGSSGK